MIPGLGSSTFADEQWNDAAFRGTLEGRETTYEVVAEPAKRFDRSGLFEEGQRRRMLAMPVNDAQDLVDDRHMQAVGVFSAVEHPHITGSVSSACSSLHLSR